MNNKNAIYKYRNDIIKSYEEYFRDGGLPENLMMSDKRSWISSLFNKIFFGDLVARHQVRNDFALRIMIRKLAESVKQPPSNVLFAIRQVAAQLVGTTDHRKVVVRE